MCGICGFTSKIIDQKKYLSQMMPFLKSRGPDSEGIYYDDKISLGHTRLSIIDLNKRSNQPLIDSKSGVSLVFNGEIYNFQEIKKKLKEETNSIFLTTSDTEVILKSYLTYGLDCFAKFDGMFAIGIWDPRYSRLILSRDKFGEKPLYYNFFFNNGKRQLSFASNLNALKFSPNFKATWYIFRKNKYLH